MKKRIKIRFQNGFTYQMATTEVLNVVTDEFDFIESDQPDFIFFGPYGIDVPKPGPYVRIGYFCENITPDLSICEWAFGVPSETEINDHRYRRIQWHNMDPANLVKHTLDAEKILASKTGFCNFLYSHPVHYREAFFKQLSKYKKVDAPGRSMNNSPGIDTAFKGDKWSVKRQFLSQYKFTIAFENYVYPGYQTEKLYDAMLSDSIPIYCGDPRIGEIFNTQSFLNTPDFVKPNNSGVVRFLEKTAQLTFTDILPQYRHSPKDRLQRKLKSAGRALKMKLQFNELDFSPLIDKIIETDKDPEKYMDYLKQPWFNNNEPPERASLRDRWMEIFNAAGQ